jgi:ketosteroid isomerase-like protein
MPSRERVGDFIALVENGEYVRAIEEFYHPDASMQENGHPPRVGRQALIEHERKVLAGLKAMRTRRVETFLVDGDRVVINWVFEMTGPDGILRVLDELALQSWKGDRIATERFYYDPAQIRPRDKARLATN